MPTIFWFLRTLAVLIALAYAAMAALVWSVQPRQTQFSEPVAVQAQPAAGESAKVTSQPAVPSPTQ